jgi:AcrR family transcriptional regulator
LGFGILCNIRRQSKGVILSAAKVAKAAGAKSLREVARAVGLHENTLTKWYKSKPELFAAAVVYSVGKNAGWGFAPVADAVIHWHIAQGAE